MFNSNVNYEDEIKAAEQRLTELKQAQAEKVAAEKKAIADARKEDAAVVNTAIDKYEEAKQTCNDAIAKAYAEYKAKVAEAEKTLSAVEAEADEKLSKFLENHPEGFHYTFRSADGKVVRNYTYRKHAYNVFDNFDKFVDAVNKLWF